MMSNERRQLDPPWTDYDRLSLAAVVAEDVRGYGGIIDSVLSLGFWVVFWYRVSHALARRHCDPLARVIQFLSQLFLHCEISRKAIIGPRLRIFHPSSVFIGPYCRLGRLSTVGPGTFIGGNNQWLDADDYPIIEDHVWVGPGAKIIGPITVGFESRIGPNAVVMQNVPPRASVMVAPCRAVSRDLWPEFGKNITRPRKGVAGAPIDAGQRSPR